MFLIKKTEEYLQSEITSEIEREVCAWRDRGMDYFRMFKLEEACTSFENVCKLKPKAHTCHSGITYFH